MDKYITEDLLRSFIKNNKKFENEYDFQFELACFLRNKYKDLEIKIEQKIYKEQDNKSNCRCDIVGKNNKGKEILLIELKYSIDEQTSCSSRASFIKDIERLKKYCQNDSDMQKCCIFLTNKTAVYNNTKNATKNTGIFNNYNKELTWKWKKASFKCENDNNNNNIYFIIYNPKNWKEPQQEK